VGRLVDGLPSRVERMRSLGNAVVPAVVEHLGRRIVAIDSLLPGRWASRRPQGEHIYTTRDK
jgi:hypothetical protein